MHTRMSLYVVTYKLVTSMPPSPGGKISRNKGRRSSEKIDRNKAILCKFTPLVTYRQTKGFSLFLVPSGARRCMGIVPGFLV